MFEVRGGSSQRNKPSLGQPGIQGSFMPVEQASTLEGLVGFMFSPIPDSPDGKRGTPSRTSNCLSPQSRTAGRRRLLPLVRPIFAKTGAKEDGLSTSTIR
jgi:hypothetical protein